MISLLIAVLLPWLMIHPEMPLAVEKTTGILPGEKPTEIIPIRPPQ